jgi:predicted kinase
VEGPARLFVVVTGLPGAGKTTVAEPIAIELGLPLLSKDAIKEALFDAVGYGGWEQSKTLSRAADAALVEAAKGLQGCVLDNFWKAETAPSLLAAFQRSMVEVWCRCEPETASRRFHGRARHPGHADDEADEPGRRASFFEHRFPIGALGPVVEVDTERPVEPAAVAGRVRTAAATLAS